MSIKKNSIYNLLGGLTPLIITIATLPLYIKHIGEERFGILSIVWLLLGYFGIFDLGLGPATAQRISKLQNGHTIERNEVFWTALSINSILGIIGATILLPTAHLLFNNYIQTSNNLKDELINSIPWMSFAIPIATTSGILTGCLQGRQRFLALNTTTIISTILFQVSPLIAAIFINSDLNILIAAVVTSRTFVFFILFSQVKKYLPIIGRPKINKSLILPLLNFGGWLSISSIISPLMTALDRFLIGSIISAKGVTHYTVPYSLASRISIIPSSLSSAILPRLSSANIIDSQRIFNEAIKILHFSITPIAAAGIIIMPHFLTLWLDKEFSNIATLTGQIILIGAWTNSYALIPFAKLLASGRPDLIAKCHLGELLPYFIALYLGLHYWGIEGAAIAWSARVTIDAILLFNLSKSSHKLWRGFILPSATIGTTFIICQESIISENIFKWSQLAIFIFSLTISVLNTPTFIKSKIKTILGK